MIGFATARVRIRKDVLASTTFFGAYALATVHLIVSLEASNSLYHVTLTASRTSGTLAVVYILFP